MSTTATSTFSAHTSDYREGVMLNICDLDILGKKIVEDKQSMDISVEYYGGNIVRREEASRLLAEATIINMAGKNIVSLAVELGLGSMDGARIISGVPFMIVFNM